MTKLTGRPTPLALTACRRRASVSMLTVGQSFLGHIRPMITGYDRMPLSPADAAIFAAEARGHDKG